MGSWKCIEIKKAREGRAKLLFWLIKVALYTILQRFEYHICINNVSVGKCLLHSTR